MSAPAPLLTPSQTANLCTMSAEPWREIHDRESLEILRAAEQIASEKAGVIVALDRAAGCAVFHNPSCRELEGAQPGRGNVSYAHFASSSRAEGALHANFRFSNWKLCTQCDPEPPEGWWRKSLHGVPSFDDPSPPAPIERRFRVIGYDAAGDDAHGVAVLEVTPHEDGRYEPRNLETRLAPTVGDAFRSIGLFAPIAVGVDTLTDWNDGPGGWRPADHWLRRNYPSVASRVMSPNSLAAVPTNGAIFLLKLHHRSTHDRPIQFTEAHPKVCYHALTGTSYSWPQQNQELTAWIQHEFGLTMPCSMDSEHEFDAAMAALAALRGLNGQWTLDLHNLPATEIARLPACGSSTRFIGPTHYWWPDQRESAS